MVLLGKLLLAEEETPDFGETREKLAKQRAPTCSTVTCLKMRFQPGFLIFAVFPPPCPSIPWFFCFLKENLKFTKDSLSLPNPQILGKDRENTKITKEIPCLKLNKEIPKTKERKDRAFF